MMTPESTLQLYTAALDKMVKKNRIDIINLRARISEVGGFYVRDNLRFTDKVCKVLNFNELDYQCAYLHKYAPLHTYIVFSEMQDILDHELDLFKGILKSGIFKMCCLGGGPGVDAIGVLKALNVTFSSFKSSVTIIDIKKEWKTSFLAIIDELASGYNACAWKNVRKNVHYIGADLLSPMTDEVTKSIASACFITMVKFVSAAVCKDTESMVKEIFRVMKPGALVLFIDNDAGGFYEIIKRSADKYSFKTVSGPLRHVSYSIEGLRQIKFGRTSCSETIVTVILLQKPLNYICDSQKSYSAKTKSKNVSVHSNHKLLTHRNDLDNICQAQNVRSEYNQDERNATFNRPALHTSEDGRNSQLENSCFTYNQDKNSVSAPSRNQTISFADSSCMTAQDQTFYLYNENTGRAPFSTFNQYIVHVNNGDSTNYQPCSDNQPLLPINEDLTGDASKSTTAFSFRRFKTCYIFIYELAADIYHLLLRYRSKWIFPVCIALLLILKERHPDDFWRRMLWGVRSEQQLSRTLGFVPSRTMLSSYYRFLNYEMSPCG